MISLPNELREVVFYFIFDTFEVGKYFCGCLALQSWQM